VNVAHPHDALHRKRRRSRNPRAVSERHAQRAMKERAQGASGDECVGLSDSGVDLLRDVRGISANSWQHS
jgi:hypothetical protein